MPEGCDSPQCVKSRGEVFYRNTSSSYEEVGQYSLSFEENLGYTGTGLYFKDTATLGLPGSGAPSLESQVLAGIKTEDFWTGSWGIRPAPLNFTTVGKPVKSLVSTLKDEGHIPSLSWGYTAGSYAVSQQSKSGLGSLTLGGYDTSLFEPHDTQFVFGPDISRDLLVSVQDITAQADSSETAALSEPVLSFIDSGTPHIWLPKSACDVLASTYSLTYNSTLDLYLWPQSTASSPPSTSNITFTLSNTKTSSSTVTISIPLSSLDLELTSDYPGITNPTRYFPIRRAANETQQTLGRAFLQHAYVIANYENSTFSVHQSRFATGEDQALQAILPPGSDGTTLDQQGPASTSDSLSTGLIVGIVIAIVAVVVLLVGGALLIRRRRREQALWPEGAVEVSADEKPELAAQAPPVYKRLLGWGENRQSAKRKLLHEMEQPPVELEVPKRNHEVAARERAVPGHDRDSYESRIGLHQEVKVVHELP